MTIIVRTRIFFICYFQYNFSKVFLDQFFVYSFDIFFEFLFAFLGYISITTITLLLFLLRYYYSFGTPFSYFFF